LVVGSGSFDLLLLETLIALQFRKRLHIVTVTIFKKYLIVTVTTFRKYLIVTVTISKKYLIVTVSMFKEHLIVTFSKNVLEYAPFRFVARSDYPEIWSISLSKLT
jgi:hypothetical protein